MEQEAPTRRYINDRCSALYLLGWITPKVELRKLVDRKGRDPKISFRGPLMSDVHDVQACVYGRWKELAVEGSDHPGFVALVMQLDRFCAILTVSPLLLGMARIFRRLLFSP
ncbi:hypothetical protein BDV98DRAFT_576237 [Pterulicium gracile]|uniref:Uncharacterized protein n=1 Tax=Pterulicium gracile TaxID=1884261 RepID=A0A5C3Q5I6_9AGAR|nr:hypothetical protein BDV98DRAFT_576237 [Pterula gracilis]